MNEIVPPAHLVDPHESVHFRKELGQFLAESVAEGNLKRSTLTRLRASRSSADSRMASTLSSCAESMKEQVLTITTSALRGVADYLHAALQQGAQHDLRIHEVFWRSRGRSRPTRTGSFLAFFISNPANYVNRTCESNLGEEDF